MTPREAAVALGCTVRHVRMLLSQGKLRGKVQVHTSKVGMQYYTWLVHPRSVEKYAKKPQGRGFPRGAKRNGPRGTTLD